MQQLNQEQQRVKKFQSGYALRKQGFGCSGRQNLPWNVQKLYHRLGFLRVTRKVFLNLDEARSAVGRAGKWSGERREAFSGTKAGAQRRRRAADGSPPLLRPTPLPLVTSARFAEWNGVVERIRGDGQPLERSKPRVVTVGRQV